VNAETKRRVDAYREENQAATIGHSDLMVEMMLIRVEEISTEVLTEALHQRGYIVTLERGYR
jgi:hypothetical protein